METGVKRGPNSPIVLSDSEDFSQSKKPKLQSTENVNSPQTPKRKKEALKEAREQERLRKLKEKEEEKRKKDEEKKKKEEERLQKLEEEKKKKEEERLKREEEKRKRDEEKAEAKRIKEEEMAAKKKLEEEQRMAKEAEKEQKRLEKEKIEEEKKKKEEALENKKKRQSNMFRSFFIEVKVERKTLDWSHPLFKPFEIKKGMKLAPSYKRDPLSEESRQNLLKENVNYTPYLKQKFQKKNLVKDPIRAKLFQFHENYRPPYYGTWRKKSKVINPRRPFSKSEDEVNYDNNSEDEWEPEPSEGEDLGSDGEEDVKKKGQNDYENDDFLMDHGYLSSNEGSNAEDGGNEGNPAKTKRRASEFNHAMTDKDNRIRSAVTANINGLSYSPSAFEGISSAIYKAGFKFSYINN